MCRSIKFILRPSLNDGPFNVSACIVFRLIVISESQFTIGYFQSHDQYNIIGLNADGMQ